MKNWLNIWGWTCIYVFTVAEISLHAFHLEGDHKWWVFGLLILLGAHFIALEIGTAKAAWEKR